MATKIKVQDSKKQEGTPLTFNTEDFVVIKLKGKLKGDKNNVDDKNYVEHKHFAERLVKSGKAEYVKGVEVEKIVHGTTILPSTEK